MAEAKQHHHLFGRQHKEDEVEEGISDDVVFTGGGGGDGFAGEDYSSENIGGGYSQTVEENAEHYEKEKKEHKLKEHLGEIDALADDDFDLYEKDQAKKDPEQGHKQKIEEEEEVSTITAAGAGCAGCTCREQQEKKEANEGDEEEEEDAEAKKKHHLF